MSSGNPQVPVTNYYTSSAAAAAAASKEANNHHHHHHHNQSLNNNNNSIGNNTSSGNSTLTRVIDLRPNMKNLDLQLIILYCEDSKGTRDGHTIYQYCGADQTGSVLVSLWNEMGRDLRPGDILRITMGYTTLYRNTLRLYGSKHGKVKRIGEFTMLFSETPNVSTIKYETK